MSKQGVVQVLQPVEATSEQLLVEQQATLQALRQALIELQGKQRVLNLIGPDLTGLSDRESLLRRAVSHLRNDLSFGGARVALNNRGDESLTQSSDVPTASFPTQVTVPVRIGHEIFGHIIVPLNGRSQLSDIDQGTLKTFAAFLAVGINNVKPLEEARVSASIDPLTGIMNRRRLFEIGPRQIARAQSTGLIVFDVDRLKVINDTFGHLAGDALIKLVARRAKECVRKTDLLARYGGDEFVILLPNTGVQSVQEIAERVQAIIENSAVEYRGKSVRSTVSIGVACVEGEVNLCTLFSRADEALYAAKQGGRNLVCFDT